MKKWFYRFTAAHFLVTAATGMVLYFRPGGGRPGLLSEGAKEWIVMVHNGEWISSAILGRPLYSGLVVGGILAFALIRFGLRTLRGVRGSQERSQPPTIRARV